MKSDTIAAIATPMTSSGIGIIRVSGEDALFMIEKIFFCGKNKKLSEVETHTVHYGYIYDPQSGEKIDEVIVIVMKGPKSYTREDTVEIDCHGGTYVMKKILEVVINQGARLAEPGEFTKRAFLNGRIDLSQAESVMDIISAKNDSALKISMKQLSGSVSNEVKELRSRIIYEIAYIESAIDDPEHISLDGYREKLKSNVKDMNQELEKLILNSENGRILKEGISTVIVGKPNVGKSSLMNLLVGEDRAIVTEIPGTTRDVLEEQINLNGIILNVVDTAGIRTTEDVVEKIGVKKAKKFLLDADLIIYVIDSSIPLDENDFEIMDLIKERNTIVLLNKSDLSSKISVNEIENNLKKPLISISAKENKGMEQLEEEIKKLFFQGKIEVDDELYITNIRHKSHLQETFNSLKLVIDSIENEMPEDFYSIDLMNAYENLGYIIGESVEDDLMNEIFNKFCTGK